MAREKTALAIGGLGLAGLITYLIRRKPKYALTVLASPPAGGSVAKYPDKAKYSYGKIVSLTAYEAPGYSLSYWEVDGEWLATGSPIKYMVRADCVITAHFIAL